MLKGLSALGNLSGILKQAMEVKGKIEAMKEKLGDERIDGSAGGGMVKVLLNGRCEMLSITIDPEIVDKENIEMLETLIHAAVNDGVQKAQELVKAKMTELTSGVNIPGITS